MKTYLPLCARPLVALAVLLAVAPLRAEDAVKYKGSFGSLVKIDGTSNIHDWTVNGQIISGTMEVSPAFDKDLKAVNPPPKVDVSIPVRSLKSNNKRMDEVMQEHMNMPKYPTIKYQLKELTLKGDPKTPTGPAEYTSKGDLTISGVTKTIEMPVTIEHADANKLKVKGTIALKMTDFNIKPPAPTIALGLIKTGDDVKLAIEWVLTKSTDTAAK